MLGLKVPSTPQDFSDAVAVGLQQLAEEPGIALGELGTVVHGTTIAVNTLIQRTGARLGLLVTDGFRDVLELQRLRLPNPFDLDGARPLPLIPRERVAEVRERLRADGRVDTPLDEASVRDAVRRLAGLGVEGLVVSLLHAYRDPAHERRTRTIAEAAAGLPVTISGDVWPQAREYERTALAVLDAYVQPKVRHYLAGFERALAARGVPAALMVTKSNGGIMPVGAARGQAVTTLLSGPASGVIGAAYIAAESGRPNVITLDVGGTSADLAVVERGRPRSSTSEHVGGVPVMMPVVGVTAIGAGGGSVAWVDDVGVPKVGPQSTGAHPGPACYARGGKEATLTDAFLVCGYLDAERFLGGRMRLHLELAEDAIARFADRLGVAVPEAAESIVRVAVSNMYAEFTKILSRAAVDPRDFALVAFGGAGPVVGALLAREVGVSAVFVPRSPGTLCALGALCADVVNDAVRTVHVRMDDTTLAWAALASRARRCAPSWPTGSRGTGPTRARRPFVTPPTCATWGSPTRSRCPSIPAGSPRVASRRSSEPFTTPTSGCTATPIARRRRRSSTCACSCARRARACRWSSYRPAPRRRSRARPAASGSTAGPSRPESSSAPRSARARVSWARPSSSSRTPPCCCRSATSARSIALATC
jgi:N-methylhydantoinase A